MSNPQEAALLKTEAYREQVARWVFEGIMAYRRSQDIPADPARLKLASAASAGTSVAAAVTNLPAPSLEAVPDFRPKTNPPVVATNPIGSAKKTRSTPAAEPEVRKAEPVEPEVRKAIPVEPRKEE